MFITFREKLLKVFITLKKNIKLKNSLYKFSSKFFFRIFQFRLVMGTNSGHALCV